MPVYLCVSDAVIPRVSNLFLLQKPFKLLHFPTMVDHVIELAFSVVELLGRAVSENRKKSMRVSNDITWGG